MDYQVEWSHSGVEAWFRTQHGHRVLRQFREQLHPLSSAIKGDKIIQLGLTSSAPLCSQLSFSHDWLVSRAKSENTLTIQADYDYLPFENESMNAILMPLSFCDRPFQDWPLDEVDRVLKSMGYVIIFAVNPLSLWGIGMHFRSVSFIHKRVNHIPSLFQLKRALMRRGFQHYHVNYFYYLPPVSKNIAINRFRVIEQMGGLFPPWPAAFYILVMKKSNLIYPNATFPVMQDKMSLINANELTAFF